MTADTSKNHWQPLLVSQVWALM